MKKLFILMMLSVMTFVCVLPSVTFAGDYMEYVEPEVKLNIVENNSTINTLWEKVKKVCSATVDFVFLLKKV